MSQTIAEFEREHNLIFHKINDPDKVLTDEQFSELIASMKFTGIDFEQREAFLKEHGYELNRKNMLDVTLSARPEVNISEAPEIVSDNAS